MSYENQVYDNYYARLREALDEVGFPYPFEPRGTDSHQIKIYLKGEAVRCYHNFQQKAMSAPRYLYVGMRCTDKKELFESFFLRERDAMEEELGLTLLHLSGKGDFWAAGVPVVPYELESLIPESVKRLQKFQKIVFPKVLKALAAKK